MISLSEQGRDGLKRFLCIPQASRLTDCLRFAAMALRYFNAAGADPQREIGEDNPETHLAPGLEAETIQFGDADCKCVKMDRVAKLIYSFL